MQYALKLNTGLQIDFENEGLDLKDFASQLNTNDLLFTSVGGSFLNKHSIVYLKESEQEEKEHAYEMTLNNGEKYILNTEEEIDSNDFLASLNSNQEYFVYVAGIIIQKHMLNTLIKLK